MAILHSPSPPFPFSLREFLVVFRLPRVVPFAPFTALLPSSIGSLLNIRLFRTQLYLFFVLPN